MLLTLDVTEVLYASRSEPQLRRVLVISVLVVVAVQTPSYALHNVCCVSTLRHFFHLRLMSAIRICCHYGSAVSCILRSSSIINTRLHMSLIHHLIASAVRQGGQYRFRALRKLPLSCLFWFSLHIAAGLKKSSIVCNLILNAIELLVSLQSCRAPSLFSLAMIARMWVRKERRGNLPLFIFYSRRFICTKRKVQTPTYL